MPDINPQQSAAYLAACYARYRTLLTTSTLPYLENGAALLAQVAEIHGWAERCDPRDLPALCAALEIYIPFYPYKEYRYRHHIKILALATVLRLCRTWPHTVDPGSIHALAQRLVANTRNNTAACYTVSLRHFIKAASGIWDAYVDDFTQLLRDQKEIYRERS